MRTRAPSLEGGMSEQGRRTYHVETGEGYRLPCWCGIDRDHTFAEWDAMATEQAAAGVAQ
jgi:hypothetical protein